MGAIVLTGIPAGYALPGNFIETNLGVGPASGNDTTYPILLLGNAMSVGTATRDTVVYGSTSTPAMQTENDVIALFGTGSEVHRMFLRVTDPKLGAGNKTTALYAVAVTESVGAAATLALTFAGTATAPGGSVRIWVGAEFVDSPITTGDTPTVIAANAVIQINAKTKWAVTAASSAGVLTLTAKNKGPRGNYLRGQANLSSPSITTTVTGAIGPTFFTGGTTADDNTAALVTITGKRFYDIVSAAEDATQYGSVVTQVNANALPAVGVRQRAFGAFTGTQSAAITISTGVNAARGEYIHSQNNDWTPLEIAAFVAAIYASSEVKPKPRHNFSGFGNGNTSAESNWKIPAPRDGTTPSSVALNTGIQNGLTPIGVNSNGSTYIVKRCTTRCLNGAVQDFRSRDAHKVTVTDYFADDWQAKLNSQFAGKDLTDDPAMGQHVPGNTVATPKTIKNALFQLLDDYNNNDQLQAVDTIKAGSVAQREQSPTTRASVRVPFTPIDILDQTTTAIDQQ